jgi:sugar (pentulose or hexulose) kinase
MYLDIKISYIKIITNCHFPPNPGKDSAMDAIAILDVGKTNAKVTLAAGGRVVGQRRLHNEPHPAPPYLHLANDRIWEWALVELADLSRTANITDIVPVAHGASVAIIDDTGLVLPMLDYEQDISDFDGEYEQLARDYAATGSPRLPTGHNTGRQLFWLQRKFPDAFVRARAILGYAQYWSFLLSGVAASELTALGCHTDLWQPRARDFAPLVDKAGWRKLMPPLRKASDVLGPVRPEIAARTGLPPDCRVRCGIHDSNATFLRWRTRLTEPFTVASTGTWIVLLVAGGALPVNGEHLDCLGSVDAFGNLVASARFMGGREYEFIKGDAAEETEPPARRLAALAAHPCFAVPAFSDQGGPFAGTRGRFVDAAGNDAIPWQRATLAALYSALMTDLLLDIVAARGPILLEGPFASNDTYVAALAALRPQSEVRPSLDALGTSLGAAMLADPDMPVEMPVTVPAPKLDLALYRARWRTFIGAKRLFADEAQFFN